MPGSWPGFSFALHLLRMQGFYFALLQYNPIQAFTARFVPSMQLYRQRHKTVRRALQWLFLQLCPLNRPRYQTYTSGYNTTACTTLERITAPQHLQRIPGYHRRAGTLHRPAQPPIIIRYIKGAQTMQSRWGSPVAWTRRAARNHWRLSPQLFSGFRPIANKGKQ